MLKPTFVKKNPFFHSGRYLRAALLPNSLNSLCTSLFSDFKKPVFGDSFSISIPLNKIYTKTLQVNVLCVVNGQREEIIVSRVVSTFMSLHITKIPFAGMCPNQFGRIQSGRLDVALVQFAQLSIHSEL